MFVNGAKCDIYIGKGAGKMLLNDVTNARASVKIVSPYLSPFLIKELINLNGKNISVQLITTDNIEDFGEIYEKNIYKLIIQNIDIDGHAVALRVKWEKISQKLLYIIVGLFVISISAAYFIRDIRLFLCIPPIAIVSIIYKNYKYKIKFKRIYSYWYSQLFPFKVYLSPNKSNGSNTFIHSKIYLIDDCIAYLGSLNFTSSGTKHNYETRIKITDVLAVEQIKHEISDLFNDSQLIEKDIQSWGKQLYREPIN